MREMTLCFIVDNDRVLLGKKKRGFGEGRYNGFGGKLESGETIHQAAVREIAEESGLLIEEKHLEPAGDIIFHFDDDPDGSFRGNIFIVQTWSGEISETDEMLPEWFSHDNLPFDEMWDDDRHWVEHVLSGMCVSGECHFTSKSNNGGQLRKHNFNFI